MKSGSGVRGAAAEAVWICIRPPRKKIVPQGVGLESKNLVLFTKNMKYWSFCILTLVLQLKVQAFTIVTNVNSLDWVDVNDEVMNLGVGSGLWDGDYYISGGGVEGVSFSTSPFNAMSNTWTLQVDNATIGTGTSAIVSYLGEEVNLQAFSDNQSRVLLNQNGQGKGFSSVQVTQSQFYITSGTGSYEEGDDYSGNRTHWGWGLFEIDYSGELTLLDSYSIWDTRFDYNNTTYLERLDGIVTGEESFLTVPEPSTYAILLGGTVLGYAYWRRRK